MRAICNAMLSYGLLNVPVGVCSSTKKKDPEFRTLHAKCGTPVTQKKWCPLHGELFEEDLAKGYEYAKNTFVQLDEGELNALRAERSKVISIRKFVAFEDVDELTIDSSYYLNPNLALVRPYALLSGAMGSRGVVGIGTSSLWGKERPSMVWGKESGALVLSILYCEDEMIPDETIAVQVAAVEEPLSEEQDLANEFIAVMIRPFDPSTDLVSPSRRRLDEYIAAKIQNAAFETKDPEPETFPTLDVANALRQSIELARQA